MMLDMSYGTGYAWPIMTASWAKWVSFTFCVSTFCMYLYCYFTSDDGLGLVKSWKAITVVTITTEVTAPLLAWILMCALSCNCKKVDVSHRAYATLFVCPEKFTEEQFEYYKDYLQENHREEFEKYF